MIENPWQISLTTDHPNGGPFTAYPWVIRLLMDRGYREEVAETVNKRALGSSELPELTREYTLEEIAIITRLGLRKLWAWLTRDISESVLMQISPFTGQTVISRRCFHRLHMF